jgi:hypothetical protein
MAGKYTEAELEMLSPEERAGIEDDSPDAAELDHIRQQKLARGETPDDPSDGYTGGDEDETPAPEPKADKAAKPEAKPADKAAAKVEAELEAEPVAKAEAAEVDDGPRDHVPQIQVERRDWVKERAELRQKYDDGDLSQDEYDEQRDALVHAQAEASLAAKINEAQATAVWKAQQDAFFEAHSEYVGKRGLKAALDVHLDRLDRETKGSLSGRALLNRAHAAVCEELGLPLTGVKTEEADAATAAKKAIDKVRTPPSEAKAVKKAIDDAPRTLGEIPAAGDEEIGLDKFAHIDAMFDRNPMEAERLIAKLSDAERAEFLGEGGERVR